MTRPNVLLIMADDMGFSDLGCYGSRIRTPHLDRLATHGIRMSQFYNTARCSPARASLLTGLHPHQTGIGILTNDDGPDGYPGTINDQCITIAEVLTQAGYRTAMSGKWHLCGDITAPNGAWPTRRGFEQYYGIVAGGSSYFQPWTLTRGEEPAEPGDDFYLTTSFGNEAAHFVDDHFDGREVGPLFLYLPFTAPHWPLHAPQDVIDSYRGMFDDGWDTLREERYRRLVETGIISGSWAISERDAQVVAWEETGDRDWQARRMEVYAAQIETMDAAIGTVLKAFARHDQLDNTLVMFLSDNGGCAEEIRPGWADELSRRPGHTPARTAQGERVWRGNDTTRWPGTPDTFASYGKPWANLSNTPFREYKHWVHEGGIATPFVAHWPAGNLQTGVDHDPHQLPDVMATVCEATGAQYPTGDVTTPQGYQRHAPEPEGTSMLGSWRGTPTAEHALFFEHEGNCAVRRGRWKLVRKYGQNWELYDMERDRTELTDLAVTDPARVQDMAAEWQSWADRCGVKPREQVLRAIAKGDGAFIGPYHSSWRAAAGASRTV